MLFTYISMLETEAEQRKITEIYNEYYGRYMHIAMKVLGDKSRAEDAVHMAFVDIISQKEKLFAMECRDFRSYTDSIVKNKAHDIIRKDKKYVDFDVGQEESIQDEALPVADYVDLKIDVEKLSVHLERLNETEQRILRSKYRLGMKNREIADDLGWTEKNVEVRLYRIRNKLYKLLESEGVTP